MKVADALRDAIVRGELSPGESITQDSVAKRFSVSTMPAREALLALSKEGMIDARPNRGFRVVRMAKGDVEDIYWAQGAVAGRLTRRACERSTAALVDELDENYRNMELALEAGDSEEVEYLSRQFHRSVNQIADSPKLVALLNLTANQIPRHFYTRILLVHDWGNINLQQHAELVTAFRRKRPKVAETLAIEHVATAGRMMIDYLGSQGYWDGYLTPEE